ncbi:MAG: pyruvoyl-dependent arginine decarboxylase [Dehalococcoidia bacterium]|nr:MAG: pyruvoyl-dependent arginine decarboxylase [Dehalococcoidia bacterium]
MWRVPEYYWITAGAAEGGSELNAFDNALLAAGVGNLNLIRVSSILPRGARRMEGRPEHLVEGTLTPAVYSVAESSTPGQLIASCVGVGRSADQYGVIFEHAGAMTAGEAEAIVRRQIEEAFARRGLALHELVLKSCEHCVERYGCTVAAVMLW